MKKKPVKKMVAGGALLGALTDGKLKAPLGIIPQLMYNQSRKKDKTPKLKEKEGMEAAPQRMREGGKVTRGDGCCMRGKTKGRMV